MLSSSLSCESDCWMVTLTGDCTVLQKPKNIRSQPGMYRLSTKSQCNSWKLCTYVIIHWNRREKKPKQTTRQHLEQATAKCKSLIIWAQAKIYSGCQYLFCHWAVLDLRQGQLPWQLKVQLLHTIKHLSSSEKSLQIFIHQTCTGEMFGNVSFSGLICVSWFYRYCADRPELGFHKPLIYCSSS